jgi:hypothetical protein
MLAAVARVRVATGLPDITWLWQYYDGREIGQDPIRLNNLLSSAAEPWVQMGTR